MFANTIEKNLTAYFFETRRSMWTQAGRRIGSRAAKL